MQLAAPKHLAAARVLGHEAPRHAQHQILQHPVMTLFERRQPHVAQQVFAQAAPGHIRVQQELMLDVVAHAFAQPVAPMREVHGAASIGNRRAVREPRDLLLQLGVTHRIHDPARVHALLREHLDLVHVDLATGGVDGDGDFHLVAARPAAVRAAIAASDISPLPSAVALSSRSSVAVELLCCRGAPGRALPVR